MRKLLIFGSDGGLGKEICNQLNYFLIIPINKNKLNFLKSNSMQKVFKILKKENPDIIINCSGVLGSNNLNYTKVFDVNFGSNWNIIRYYLVKNNKKNRKIVLIGSSGYNKGKKDYMLYSASKNALHSLYLSAKEILKKKNIKLDIFHPATMNTKMIKNIKYKKKKIFDQRKIAKKIIYNYKIQ